MDDRYLDVLDATGRTPREAGAVQLHVASAVQAPGGDTLLTLFLQAAYEPYQGGTLTLSAEGEDGKPVLPEDQRTHALPPLPNGAVVRWEIPLRLRATGRKLKLEVLAPLPRGASRVRQAWKLFTEEPQGDPLTEVFRALGDALLAPFGFARKPVSKPVTLEVELTAGAPRALDAPAVQSLWELGQPMPS